MVLFNSVGHAILCLDWWWLCVLFDLQGLVCLIVVWVLFSCCYVWLGCCCLKFVCLRLGGFALITGGCMRTGLVAYLFGLFA